MAGYPPGLAVCSGLSFLAVLAVILRPGIWHLASGIWHLASGVLAAGAVGDRGATSPCRPDSASTAYPWLGRTIR
jgi:hypothetical protein